MMKILTIIFCVVTYFSYGQKVTIEGKVYDESKGALPSATVMLLNRGDSSLVNFAVTNAEGLFQLKNVSAGDYQVKITFVGFQSYTKNIDVKDRSIQLGEIKMAVTTKELDELIIEGEKAPVTVKRDTIEFNASSFKTKPNANVEDLLKKLPGVEVENDGTVRAQGENVQRVTVDGREFFGRDPKLATRNLPADAVDKVQVFDKKSDQAVFTGIDDGQREKTINLELKEEKRNGAFGSLMAGAGTTDRIESKASINKFTKTKQMSFLGMGNNINEQGFSLDDYMNFSGSSQNMMGGGGAMRIEFNSDNQNGVPLNLGGGQNGITTNYAGGINLNKDFNSKLKAGGSYFYNHVDQDVKTTVDRINYLPNGSYSFNQKNLQRNVSDNHRLNLMVDHKIDSANSLKLTANISTTQSKQNTLSQSQTFNEFGLLQNESDRTVASEGSGLNFNSSLLFRHRFAKKGRSFSTNFNLSGSNMESDGEVGSFNQFYIGSGETQNLVQINAQKNKSLSYGVTSSYIEPLGGRKYLEVNYAYSVNTNDVNREVWDASAAPPTLDPLLSNKYSGEYVYNRPGLNLRIIRQKYNLSFGTAWQSTQLNGDLEDIKITKSFNNLLPVARFNYDFSNFKRMRLDYETSVQEPAIQDLQPVVNNNDPLNLVEGNPDLKPGYSHQLRSSFTLFDPGRFISFFSFIDANYTADAISSAVEVDENLVRTTKPVNVSSNYSINASLQFGFQLRKIKSRINLRTNTVAGRGITLLNAMENTIQRQTFGGSINYTLTLGDVYNLNLSTSMEEQQSRYDFGLQDQVFLNKTYEVESNLKFLKNFQWNARFRFIEYSSQTTGFSQEVPFLDLSISRFLLKNNVGELKIGVNNLLDRNVSITQTTNANYLEQRTANNLGRYFMISFTYALNKQFNPMTGAGSGRVMIRR